MNEHKNYEVPGVTRTFKILNFIAENGCAKASRIYKELGMPKTTAFVMLTTLLESGYLNYSRKEGYSLGLKLFSLGSKALINTGLDIREQAAPIMNSLVMDVGQTSYFGVLNGKEAVYIAKTESKNNQWETLYDTGMNVTVQIAAIGKALLAWRNEKDIRAIISENTPTRHTSRAILDPDAFVLHLGTMRRHGFVFNNRETVEDSICVAAPVFSKQQDAPIAGLSVVTPHERMTAELFAFASEQVYGAARLLSEQLGAKHYPEFVAMSYQSD